MERQSWPLRRAIDIRMFYVACLHLCHNYYCLRLGLEDIILFERLTTLTVTYRAQGQWRMLVYLRLIQNSEPLPA